MKIVPRFGRAFGKLFDIEWDGFGGDKGELNLNWLIRTNR